MGRRDVGRGTAGGAPLVLMADAGRPPVVWSELVGRLARPARAVVPLDLVGQADPGGRTGPELRKLTGQVLRRLEGLDRPAHLVGWGFGGALALAAAARRPDLVVELTLVGTSGWVVDPALPGPDELIAVLLATRARQATDAGALERVLAREHRALTGSADRPSPEAASAEARRWVRAGASPDAGLRAAWVLAPPLWAEAARSTVPVTVLHGEHDPLVPVEHGRRLASVTRGRLVELPGVGHELTAEVVDALEAVLLDPAALGRATVSRPGAGATGGRPAP